MRSIFINFQNLVGRVCCTALEIEKTKVSGIWKHGKANLGYIEKHERAQRGTIKMSRTEISIYYTCSLYIILVEYLACNPWESSSPLGQTLCCTATGEWKNQSAAYIHHCHECKYYCQKLLFSHPPNERKCDESQSCMQIAIVVLY